MRDGGTKRNFDLSGIRLLVLDFDGVLTDNRVLVSEDGSEAVFCHRGDGMGLEMLRENGIEAVVLSKERNPVVGARCRKLHLDCHQGLDDKVRKLAEICADRSISSRQVAYMGNDVNDLECMQWAGVGVAVADAMPSVLSVADLVTDRRGGYGAVRELCDLLIDTCGIAGRAGSP